MRDGASGSVAGIIFQFEKAVLLLANLKQSNDFVSIEDVDDVAAHREDGTVLITLQGKHSIASSGSTFEDTSYALWRTFEIWINKLKDGVFNAETVFSCSTNKAVSDSSLLRKILTQSDSNALVEIEMLLEHQKQKLERASKGKGKDGETINKVIALMSFVLSERNHFKVIKSNLKIDDEQDVHKEIEAALLLTGKGISGTERSNIIENLVGWAAIRSIAQWRNGQIAKLTKSAFDDKYHLVRSTPSIVKAIFRNKRNFEALTKNKIDSKRDSLFVRQIQDLKRNKEVQEDIITDAIHDFVYYEIELQFIIDKGNFTKEDFKIFENHCLLKWKESVAQIVLNDLTEYSEDDLNKMGLIIFNDIMYKTVLNFLDEWVFNIENRYVRNGCFLKLSDIPQIGWRPDWRDKYR